MRNRRATSQNSVLFSTGHFRLRDIVRLFTIQLHLLGFPHALAQSPCVLSLVQTVCQQLSLTQSADGGLAKPRGKSLTVAEFSSNVLYHAIERWRGKSGGRSLISVSPTS